MRSLSTRWRRIVHRFSPATALSGGDLGVAGGAKRHEVRFLVRSALGQRYDVVHLLRWGDFTMLLAPLTQQVGSDKAVTHTLPRTTVAFLHSGVTLVAFAPLGFLLGVLLAEPTVGQARTTGVGARSFRFVRHHRSSSSAKQKALASLRAPFANLATYSITQVGANKTNNIPNKTNSFMP